MDEIFSKPIRGPGHSGWVGVVLEKRSGKWVALVRLQGVLRRLGEFESAESAARARAEALARALRFKD